MRILPPIAAALLLLSACSSDTTGSRVEGTYTLVELKGQPLPYDDGTGCCIYQGGSLALSGGRSYTVSITARNRTTQATFTVTESGDYLRSGDRLQFTREQGTFGAALHDARLEGGAIRLSLGGDGPGAADQHAAVFRK